MRESCTVEKWMRKKNNKLRASADIRQLADIQMGRRFVFVGAIIAVKRIDVRLYNVPPMRKLCAVLAASCRSSGSKSTQTSNSFGFKSVICAPRNDSGRKHAGDIFQRSCSPLSVARACRLSVVDSWTGRRSNQRVYIRSRT